MSFNRVLVGRVSNSVFRALGSRGTDGLDLDIGVESEGFVLDSDVEVDGSEIDGFEEALGGCLDVDEDDFTAARTAGLNSASILLMNELVNRVLSIVKRKVTNLLKWPRLSPGYGRGVHQLAQKKSVFEPFTY